MSEVTIALNQDREMSILCDANKFLANISYHNYNSDQQFDNDNFVKTYLQLR